MLRSELALDAAGLVGGKSPFSCSSSEEGTSEGVEISSFEIF